MAKISMALLVALLAGCSNMGHFTRDSSSGGMGAASGSPVYPVDFEQLGSGGTVIDPRTGDLTVYHGG